MKKEIIFFNRAYNDMDIQLSLMSGFAKDPTYRVRVIGIPCDGLIGSPHDHEAAQWINTATNIKLESVLQYPQTPIILKFIDKAKRLFKANGQDKMAKIANSILVRILNVLYSKNYKWLEEISNNWNPVAVFIDEVSCQTNRSYIVDNIIPKMATKGVKIYTILTGHNIYYDPFPSNGKRPVYKKSFSTRTFVPSKLDAQIHKISFPDEVPEVMGNLRMNAPWIKNVSAILSPPYFDREKSVSMLPQGKVKVALMLSKLSYGVEVELLKDTIRALGSMTDVALAIKPHTRGMKFDFMNENEIGRAFVAADTPSAILSDWADLVLITGSSVIFNAMILGKDTGILKYCQRHETIFDAGVANNVFSSLDELLHHINNFTVTPLDEGAHKWICETVYAGISSGKIAQRYKEIVDGDLANITTPENLRAHKAG